MRPSTFAPFIRSPCALAPVRLYPFAVAVHVRPLHPHTPKATPKQPPKQAEKPTQNGGEKPRPKGATPTAEKSRNYNTRVTRTYAHTIRARAADAGYRAHNAQELPKRKTFANFEKNVDKGEKCAIINTLTRPQTLAQKNRRGKES